jgi:hypothetical protein
MSDITKFSDRVIEYAERAAAMADAAQGKKSIRKRGMAQLLVLPAAGAGLYALARNKAVVSQAKEVASDAKSFAADLPEELLTRVRKSSQPSRAATSSNGGSRRTSSASRRKPSTTRTRTPSSR